jgi:hypothetical protein
MFARSSKFPPRLILILGGLLLFVLLVHLAGVALLRYFVERELHPALPKGTYIGEVHVNLFTGTLTIEDFELYNAGLLRLRFGTLELQLDPWRLLNGTVAVEKAALRRAYARIERRADGSFDLGLPAFGSDAGPPSPPREPPDLRIAGMALEGLRLDYLDGPLASVLIIDKLQVGAYSMRASRQDVPLQWGLRWDERAIEGEAVATLHQQGLAVTGRVQTGLLDLGRAQRLARLDPILRGEFAYQGPFDWQPPRLGLGGVLSAPQLDYRGNGQTARLSGLSVPAFSLQLLTAPTPSAELVLDEKARLEGLTWQGAGQGAELERLGLVGRLRYLDDDAVEASGLAIDAQRLAWRDAGRQVGIEGVGLSGSLRQSLAAGAGLPTLAGRLAAASLSYSDSAETLALGLTGLQLRELALDPAAGGPGPVVSASIELGAGEVTREGSVVGWAGLQARLDGVIADVPTLGGELQLSELRLADPSLPNGPLTLAQVTARGLELAEQTGFTLIHLGGIELPAATPGTALKVATVDLRDGSYSAAAGVTLGEIVIDGLQTGVVRDKTGEWRHLLSSDRAAPAPEPVSRPAGEGGPAWRIGGVRVTGDSQLYVADMLNRDMEGMRYRVEKLELGALASDAPGRDTPFEIGLRPDRYSEFLVKGTVRPLAENLRLKAEGHLHGFGLSSVNGLVAKDLGHRFLDGQLDNDFTITIADNRLDMGNRLGLAGLAVEEIPGREGPPLATAIALLEDRDGNIRLELPVAGDLADPDFRVLGALNPIIMKAVAGTAALAIQPLGSVLLVGGLLADQALRVTFEPALFEPGSADLTPASSAYLAKLGAKLSEKPKLAVRVCGLVAETERKKDKNGAYLDQEADLLPLAQQRADAVRAELQRSGAAAAQLRACRPALDANPAANPRVDIRF